MAINEVFGKHKFDKGEVKSFFIGNSALWAKRENEGWYIQGKEKQEVQNEPIDFARAEYFQTGQSDSIVIAPALPEKPIVFKSSQIKILPKQKFIFFLKFPISVQIFYSRNSEGNMLKEIPSKRLSDTWFGDSDSGEAAFALGDEYFLDFNTIETSPFEAICPVSVFNNSPNIFEIQRQIIRVENLSLYNKANRIVTSLIQVEYKGQQILSSANYHYSKIFNGGKQDILSKARNDNGKNLLKINFHFIKNIYQNRISDDEF